MSLRTLGALVTALVWAAALMLFLITKMVYPAILCNPGKTRTDSRYCSDWRHSVWSNAFIAEEEKAR